jgi:hypothetical protein
LTVDLVEEDVTPDGAEARPSKSLFIAMMTRDIELIPAILELWDNSIDGAMRQLQIPNGDADAANSLSGFEIDINLHATEFSIEDNCGGIELDVARKFAFRLGRLEDSPSVDGAVGSFGVGMKRALFKLGSKFSVESDSRAGSFRLDVNVVEWSKLDDPYWRLPFTSSDASASVATLQDGGTRIHVTGLPDAVAAQFKDTQFLFRLRHELELRRPEAFERGIVTRLNGRPLSPRPSPLLASNDFHPLVIHRDAGSVHITLRAGLAPSERDTSDDQPVMDDGDGTQFMGEDRAGWYVTANGRVLLAAERTALTGWGNDLARYHPQYRNFRGYLDIRADHALDLPWNTTKTGVDESAPIWQTIYAMMHSALGEVQRLLNRIKRETTEEAESGEAGAVLQALRSATVRDATTISPRQDSKLRYPKTSAASPKTPTLVTVSFKVETARYKRVLEDIGAESKADLGRALFDYYWLREME